MAFIVKPWQGIIGLWLQERRFNARGCAELRHPPSVEQVCDKACDEHGFTSA